MLKAIIRFENVPKSRIFVWKAEATVDLTEEEYCAAQFAAGKSYKRTHCFLNGTPFVIGIVSSCGLRNRPTLKAHFNNESEAQSCGGRKL